MNQDWIDVAKHPVTAGNDPVVVWHIYSGVMLERRDRVTMNPFYTHWREIDHDAWIETNDRLPKNEDADAYDCVIAQNRWGETAMAGWHRFESEPSLVRWQSPPSSPWMNK